MAHTLDSSKTNPFNISVTAVFKGIKKGFLFACSFALVVMLQVTFFGSGAIASPLANIFGDQVDKVTQGVKTDIAIDKAAGTAKEIGRDLRDGRTDKVIDKLADTSKSLAKEAEKRSKELAKNVKEGTKENLGKAKDLTKDAKGKIGEGVEKTGQVMEDGTDGVKEGTKDLPEKVGNTVERGIDSVTDFIDQ